MIAHMKKPPIVRAAERTTENEESGAHPWNPSSDIRGHALSRAVGMTRLGLWAVRVPPGKESFVYHRHHLEEEFLYVLSGRGVVEIDDEKHEIGTGDFVGFPAGTAHHLLNPFEEDLVYLSGGENREVEIADYPRHGKRMVRVGGRADVYPLSAGEAMAGVDKM
jgi:uncharacterized cupin superfamily protein